MAGQAFTSAAAYYALFAEPAGRIDREGPFLADILNRALGGWVADLACGTGLHAAFFAEKGATVDAFDLSPDMIAEAMRLHPHPLITYHTGDMRNISGGPWDLAVCLGNSLSLLPGDDDLASVFGGVARSLSTGGLFVTQTLNYSLPAYTEPRQRIERRSSGGTEIIAIKNLVPHHGRTLLSIFYFSDSGGCIESIADSAVLRHLDLATLVSAASSAGLTLDKTHGGYIRSAFDPETSTDILCVFRSSKR
jgi:SAM-dependent methyltransferase